MTARTETNAAIARVLSGALQAVLTHQRTGSAEEALPAFVGEYEHDLTAAMAAGPDAVEEFREHLTVYAITALFFTERITHITRMTNSLDVQRFGGKRAAGGPIIPSRCYLVGEQGPEIVTPREPTEAHTAAATRSLLSSSPRAATSGGPMQIEGTLHIPAWVRATSAVSPPR